MDFATFVICYCAYNWFLFKCLKFSVVEYERSWEQNEELGLNDMDTSSADVAYAS